MMNKVFTIAFAAMLCSASFAQDGEGRGQVAGQGRGVQTLLIPESVVKANLPLDAAKFESLVADLKVLQSVNLPLEAVTELKLTVDQKKALVELAKTSQAKVRELMQNGDREGAMELRGQIVNKVASVLTADQKKVVEKYPAPRMGQGGGRGNRPGGPPSSK
jgi:hypothetical protein